MVTLSEWRELLRENEKNKSVDQNRGECIFILISASSSLGLDRNDFQGISGGSEGKRKRKSVDQSSPRIDLHFDFSLFTTWSRL